MSAQTTPAATPETAQRDARGRFAPGNAGGPGNPFARQTAALRFAFVEAMRPEDVAEIVQALLVKARAGDVAAAKLLLSYGLGKPAPANHPDRLDEDEWQRFQKTAPIICEAPKLFNAPDPSVPLEALRQTRAIMAEQLRTGIAAMVQESEANAALLDAQSGHRPSTNGQNGKHRPSANGNNGRPRPSETVSVFDPELWAAIQAANSGQESGPSASGPSSTA